MDWLKTYDSWTTERISRHFLYWAAWSTFYILTNYFTAYGGDLWQFAAFEMLVLPIKMGCTYTIAYWVMPQFLYKKKYLVFALVTIAVAFFFGWLLYLMYFKVIYPEVFGKLKAHDTIGQFVFKGVELVYIASVVLGIKFFQNYEHERQLNQSLRHEKVEAELKYLKNQVQPHFLFNTLNNIYGMVLSKDKNASDTIVKLSEMLGYMLYDSNVPLIALAAEVDNLENFIALERLRYDRKLDFQFEKTMGDDDLFIAPLLLLPFVENAFKHGPGKEEKRSFIRIRLEVDGKILYFEVENSYNESQVNQAVQSGIGLPNIAKRLALLYPDKHTLDIHEEGTFKIQLRIELAEAI